MSMTDPIADMLTRIRNANRIGRGTVRIPRPKVKVGISEVLKHEGYIQEFRVLDEGPQGWIEIDLKYGPEGEHVIQRIVRTSKPGRRIYSQVNDLKPVLNGPGIAILTTPNGVLSDREARSQRVGGEILCTVW